MPDYTQQERDFMLDRLQARQVGCIRYTGRSSDALVEFAFSGEEPDRNRYPYDLDDLGACERTAGMAPEHLRRRMEPLLLKYRQFVADNYKRWGRDE